MFEFWSTLLVNAKDSGVARVTNFSMWLISLFHSMLRVDWILHMYSVHTVYACTQCFEKR